MEENVEAVALWGDINLLGWDAAIALRKIAVTEYQADKLLVKLRVIAAEFAKIRHEKAGKNGQGN